ncbi:unnamed protein product [Haemonchus placei]|uniref:ATP synthase subunit b n=1 Tax=Haemonchus placei TaxID=6290 RepID=A0A3P7XA07_HAEPC|nr:unnamed protein product [Haemonchus placei]
MKAVSRWIALIPVVSILLKHCNKSFLIFTEPHLLGVKKCSAHHQLCCSKKSNVSILVRLDNYLYGEYQKRMDYYKGLIAEDLKDAVEFRKTSAAETDSLNAVKENFPVIMKENMQLQLEATYRKNVQSVATELKRRLDYLKETEETKKRFEKEQMLKFITEGVEKEASDRAFKDKYLQNAIQTLKGLQVQV